MTLQSYGASSVLCARDARARGYPIAATIVSVEHVQGGKGGEALRSAANATATLPTGTRSMSAALCGTRRGAGIHQHGPPRSSCPPALANDSGVQPCASRWLTFAPAFSTRSDHCSMAGFRRQVQSGPAVGVGVFDAGSGVEQPHRHVRASFERVAIRAVLSLRSRRPRLAPAWSSASTAWRRRHSAPQHQRRHVLAVRASTNTP